LEKDNYFFGAFAFFLFFRHGWSLNHELTYELSTVIFFFSHLVLLAIIKHFDVAGA